MASRSRLLVALALGGRVAIEVDGLRRALGSSQIDRIPPHLTLVPPANLSEDVASAAPERVARIAARHAPFPLRLGPVATFPGNHSVLFLAVAASAELASLRAELLADAFGEPVRDERSFVPHVTLDSRRRDFVDEVVLGTLAGYRAEVMVDSVQLFVQLEQVATRPWSQLGSFDLGAARIVGRGGLEVRVSAGSVSASWPLSLVSGWGGGEGVRPTSERYCLAELDGRAVGLLTWSRQGGEVRITRHLVEPGHRGLGIGSKLLAFVEAAAQEAGTTRLRVVVDRPAAEHYYLGRGFGVAGTAEGRVELVRELGTRPQSP